MKALIASSALVLMSAGTAFAGPYVVVETNSGFYGSDFTGSVTDLHIGYEDTFNGLSYYAEIGPSSFNPDKGVAETLVTTKAGGSYSFSEKLSGYTELAITLDDTNSYGTKLGVKYSF